MKQCIANKKDGTRCKCLAMNGYDLCYTHLKTHETRWRIELSFRPAQRLPNGRYKKTVIAKDFAEREHAENYLSDNWAKIIAPFPTRKMPHKEAVAKPSKRRFVSACITPRRIERKFP